LRVYKYDSEICKLAKSYKILMVYSYY